MILALLTPPGAATRLHPELRSCLEPVRARLARWVIEERAAGRAAELVDPWAEGRTLADLSWSSIEEAVIDGPVEDAAFVRIARRIFERRGCCARSASSLGWPAWSLRELAEHCERPVVWAETEPARSATTWVRTFRAGAAAELADWGSRAHELGLRPVPWFEVDDPDRDHSFIGVYPARQDRELTEAARSFYRQHLADAFTRYLTWEPHARAGVDPWLDVFAGRSVDRAMPGFGGRA